MENKSKQKTPDISIDDALNLFLAVTYPNGIPEGVDKEQLMTALKQKIAKDRPEWAQTDEERTRASRDAGSPSDSQSYSQLKEEITRKAQQEDIPEDPEERYLYERGKEARRNREQKRAEEQEHRIREDLRKRLMAQKKEEDQETLDKAVLIRKTLEKRLRQTLKIPPTESPAKEGKKPLDLNMQSPNMAGLTPLKNIPTPPAATTNNLAPPAPALESKNGKEGAGEFYNQIKDLSPDEQVRSLQEWNSMRRSKLKSKEDLLSSRKPSETSKRAGPLPIDMDKGSKKENETDDLMTIPMESKKGEALANNMDFSSGQRSSRLTLE